jgi:hypothetical protein
MNNRDSLSNEFHAELIQRFLNELDSTARRALGDAKITISFGGGDQETVELAEKYPILLSPAVLILHIQAEPEAYFWALSFLIDTFIEASGRAGLEHFSMCMTPIVGVVFYCEPNDQSTS